MWASIVSYAFSSSNYQIMNINNVHNFMMSIMESLNDEEKEKFVHKLKIHIGLTYAGLLASYIFAKAPNSPLLKYFA